MFNQIQERLKMLVKDRRITPDNFYFELYNLWDIYSESQFEQEVKILEITEALL